MDFFDSVRVLLRRWYVVLLGLLLLGGAAYYAIAVVPTNYQARAQYVLLLPAGSPGPGAINPYLNLNGGLTFAASLIASDIGTKAAIEELADAGFTSTYTIGLSTGAGPVLEVSASGTDPDDVLATRDAVLTRFDQELDELQAIPGIPSRQRIFSRTNAVDPVAEAVPGAKKKALLLIVALGGTLTLIAAFTVDGLLRRRSRTARTSAETQPAPEPEPHLEPASNTHDTLPASQTRGRPSRQSSTKRSGRRLLPADSRRGQG